MSNTTDEWAWLDEPIKALASNDAGVAEFKVHLQSHFEQMMREREQAIQLIAERRGEKYQLLMLKHWMTLHDRDVTIDDVDHILESFKQFPGQPLARVTLAALTKEEKK